MNFRLSVAEKGAVGAPVGGLQQRLRVLEVAFLLENQFLIYHWTLV